MLVAKNLTLTKNKVILNDISLEVPSGSMTTFLGKSGSGKSSLLRCLAQIDSDYKGSLCYQGRCLRSFSSKEKASLIGFISQSYGLFSHMTVLDNIAKPMEIVMKMGCKNAKQKAYELLEIFGLQEIAKQYPKTVSGGQKQRVAILRALGMDSKILMLDEPTSALDPINTRLLLDLLRSLQKEGKTIIVSTQDISFAKIILGRAYFLENGSIIEENFGTQLVNGSKLYHFLNE